MGVHPLPYALPRTVFACLVSASLWAGPPYLTDDPEPVERHHWETYLFAQGFNTPGGRSGVLPAFEANYGPFANAQLQFQIPIAYEVDEQGLRHRGLGDLQMGFKYRFLEETAGRPQMALYPQIQAPTGREVTGLGNDHWRFYLPLLFQKSFGPWTTYGGPGWWRNPGEGKRDYATFGWLVQRSFGEDFSLGAEIFHQGADVEGGKGATTFNLGFTRSLSPRWAAVGSLGRVFHGETGHQLYLGLRGSF